MGDGADPALAADAKREWNKIAERPIGNGAKPAFAASGFVVLRTPLLAFDELLALGAELTAAATTREAPADLDAALAADRARLVDRLRELASRPEVREAIQLASPIFDESLAIWLERRQSRVRPVVRLDAAEAPPVRL